MPRFMNIKLAAVARGLHLFEVAARCKKSPAVLSEVIAGRRSANPALRAKLAAVLRCDENWLFAQPEIPKSAAMRELTA